MTVTRWALGVDVLWRTPITFDRRRNDFLEWAEDSVELTEFFEYDEAFGIAVDDREHRLIIDRHGMQIRLEGPAADLARLEASIDHVLTTLEPNSVQLSHCVTVSSCPVDVDYEVARRGLTSRSLRHRDGTVEPIDCAILWDGLMAGAAIQCEFGVVTARELETRLTTMTMSRVAQAAKLTVRSVPDADNLPEVSALATSTWRPLDTRRVTPAASLLAVVSKAEDDLLQVAEISADAVASAARQEG